MAHFYDLSKPTEVHLSGQTIHVHKGSSLAVGLWGGELVQNPDGTARGVPLKLKLSRSGIVTTPTDPVTVNPPIYKVPITGISLGSCTLEAYDSNNVTYDRLVVDVVEAPAKKATKWEQRDRIANAALQWVESAHYLWATAGDYPGQGGGARYKPSASVLKPPSLDKSKPSVQAAMTKILTGVSVCGGRFSLNPAPADLDTYLAEVGKSKAGGLPQESWATVAGRTPRVWWITDEEKSLVWGESCVGRRHFDCIGLVCYAIEQSFKGGVFGLDLKVLMENPANAGAVVVTDARDVLPGDIVGQNDPKLGWHHIGLLYLDGNTAKVVQAEDTNVGLTRNTVYNASAWTKRIRMIDEVLV